MSFGHKKIEQYYSESICAHSRDHRPNSIGEGNVSPGIEIGRGRLSSSAPFLIAQAIMARGANCAKRMARDLNWGER